MVTDAISSLFRKIGIYLPARKGEGLRIGRRFLTFLGVLFFLSIFGFLGLLKYSTSPSFCNSCHVMHPYYNAWKTSSHNFVSCVDCHYPPGLTKEFKGKIQAITQVVKFVTRTYSTKPYAEIEDSSCLRKGCHEKRLLEGKVTFKRGIIFDHKPHLVGVRRGKRLRCTSCHSQIVQGQHIAVTEEVCFLCHFKGEKNGREITPVGGCPLCHGAPEKEIKIAAGVSFNHKDFVGRGVECQKCHLDAVQGDGEAPREMCLTCHGEPERLSRYEDHEFIHENHVTKHKVECFQCHLTIKHAVQTTIKPLEYSCDVCHLSKHAGEKEMYMGKGGRGVEDMPSPMFLAQVDCVACHINPGEELPATHFTGKTYKPTGAACFGCHGKGYAEMLDSWKSALQESLNELEPILKKASELVQSLNKEDKGYQEVSKLLEDAEYNYNFVKFGKGLHNVSYANTLIEVSRNNARKVISILSEQR